MNRLRQHDLGAVLHDPFGQQHGLAQRRGAVVERGVGDVEAGQQALVGLVLEDRLERALRDLGLVRCVGREELGAEEELIDAGRLVVGIGATAQEREVVDRGLVLRGHGAKPAPRLDLGPWPRHVEERLQLDVLRDGVEQPVDGVDADRGQHLLHVLRGVRNVAVLGDQGIRKAHKECWLLNVER